MFALRLRARFMHLAPPPFHVQKLKANNEAAEAVVIEE
jgi:hypothetical protein